VLFGCPHAPAGLRWQESELRAGRNGLARRGRDDGPRPTRILTYRQWKAAQITSADGVRKLTINGKTYPWIGSVSVFWINAARATGKVSRHVYWVQVWLRKLGYYKAPLDGRWGKATQAALDNYRRHGLRWPRADWGGPIGIDSLTRLRDAAHSSLKVRKDR
jgi:hypothetical protein